MCISLFILKYVLQLPRCQVGIQFQCAGAPDARVPCLRRLNGADIHVTNEQPRSPVPSIDSAPMRFDPPVQLTEALRNNQDSRQISQHNAHQKQVCAMAYAVFESWRCATTRIMSSPSPAEVRSTPPVIVAPALSACSRNCTDSAVTTSPGVTRGIPGGCRCESDRSQTKNWGWITERPENFHHSLGAA